MVSKKINGDSIILNAEVVESRLTDAINKATDDGHKNILLLCTGEFNNFQKKDTNLFIPDKILTPLVANMFPNKKMGLLIPDETQINMMNSKWGKHGFKPLIKYASPYSNISKIIKACNDLDKSEVDFILMDCMGYTEQMKDRVKEIVDVPVILSNVLMVKVLSEIL